MDNMVYQCSNQNSIYVLNAGYNPSYGDFSTHATGREMNGSRTTTAVAATRTRNSIGASCSSAACSLQHKFKSFGTTAASSGNSSAVSSTAAAVAAAATTTMATTIIAAAAAAMTPTTTAAAAAAAITTNYANPVATSMSTAMCSPATTALQKLFNCSGVVGGNVCQNVSHRNQQHNHSHNHSNHNSSSSSSSSSSGNNNNNCPLGSHNNCCLSATSSHSRICDPLEFPLGTAVGAAAGAGAGVGAGALPLLGAVANKKKCTNVKSTLIAKKTKFLKFLEEEKWRNSNNIYTEVAEDASGASAASAAPTAPTALAPSSNEADLYTAMAMASASSLGVHSTSKNNNNSREAAGAEQQQNKLNNWSMHNENNNKLTNYTQQQQQQQREQQQRELECQEETTTRSSYELYQEAADILGLSCSLCDNCRCLDCQSGYFDCAYDDDDESYSEQSLMDEYDEYNDDYSNAYCYEQQQRHQSYHAAAAPNQPTIIQTGQQHHQQQEQQQDQEATEQNLCYALECKQNCSKSDDAAEEQVEQQMEQRAQLEQLEEVNELAEATLQTFSTSKSEHRLDIDFDLINATSSQVLQNCATFNDLSLLDVEQQQVEPFT